MKKKITITDIAQKTGVSITTVSFILNGKAVERKISRSVVERVTNYVKRVGFELNKRKSRSAYGNPTIVVILEDVHRSFFSNFWHKSNPLMQNFDFVFMSHMGDLMQLEKNMQQIKEISILDGLILEDLQGLEKLGDSLSGLNIPISVLGSCSEKVYNSLGLDFFSLTAGVIKSIFERSGAKKIGLICSTSNTPLVKETVKGYMEAVDVLNLDVLVKKISSISSDASMLIKEFVVNNNLQAVVFSHADLAKIGYSAFKNEDTESVKLYCLQNDDFLSYIDEDSHCSNFDETEMIANMMKPFLSQ